MGLHVPTNRNFVASSIFAQAIDRVRAFASSDAVNEAATLAFGDDVNGAAVRDAVRAFDKNGWPKLEIVSGDDLAGGHAAYAAASDTIFLSRSFLESHAGDTAAILNVLVEELGHAIDARVNATDAAGDEGAIFAALVSGRELSGLELSALHADSDNRQLTINGRVTNAELAGTYGAITVNGSLSDWVAADRLDAGPASVSGYEVYGKVVGGAYVIGLKSLVAINANTTFWFNTDGNVNTGYKIWGFASGAEYNVNLNAAGVPTLYTGAAGQTAVASTTLDYTFSSDRKILEFAIPLSKVGNAPSALMLIDVNDSVFLSPDYLSYQYTVDADPVVAPPSSVGGVTLDGALGDWTAAQRIDATMGVAGFEIYGRDAGDSFVLAIKSTTAIGANTTAWLNTDNNVNTGYKIWGFAGGAEYNINFDAAGKPVLYTGAAGQTLVSNVIPFGISADRLVVEIAISKALIGSPTTLSALFDINDSIFLPSDYSATQYVITSGVPPTTVGDITLNGALTDWTAAQRIDFAGAVANHEVYGKITGNSFVFALKAPGGIGSGTTVWLNTDQNAATGFQISGAVGAEYHIEFDGNGVPALFNSVTGVAVAGASVQYGFSADKTIVEFAVTTASVGSPSAINAVLDVNNTTYLPGNYSGPQYVIAPPPPTTQVGDVTIDGNLTEWTTATRIDKGAVPTGYEIYGKVAGDSFVVALKSAVAFTTGSTLWLNTDQNETTGAHPFGGAAGGAEYTVKFGADGKPALYLGDADAGGTLISNSLVYNYSADRKSLEIAIPKASIGSPAELNMILDINDAVYLPENYVGSQYEIRDTAQLTPRVDMSKKVAIVYSETTANQYFSKTAYGQLFMNAQSQAASAGVPFDILTEADLKDINKLKEYDSIVFPSFRNVKAADYQAIASTLEIAVEQYKVGIITAGDFMTNNETNAAIMPDPYKVMKELLDLWRTDGGMGAVKVTAATNTHPIMEGYTVGETIRDYASTPWSLYSDPTTGDGIVHTVLSRQTINGVTRDAVVAIENNGRNVHFSDASLMADNNQLQHAIEYSVGGTGVTLGLQMSRFTSLFASRNDMDQAQQVFDVTPEGGGPGIYNALVPILQDWKALYNFVGSYYIDIGNRPPEEMTVWSTSNSFYNQMLALGNEIGSHSYTHPENTNLLFPNLITQEMLDNRIAQYQALLNTTQRVYTPYVQREDADPSVVAQLANLTLAQINARLTAALAAPDPSALGEVDKALLESTYSFQFGKAREVILANLPGATGNAAVPGATEQLEATLYMLEYMSDYLSGGISMTGAGYPGAFGYVLPGNQDKVYLAPNISFDFTLVGFQGKTAEQALAQWQAEFAALTAHGDVPVVLWPWHDYGPTNWILDEGVTNPGYTRAMFQNFIATAYNAGAEFVTLLDLADRIKAFEKSTISYTVVGNVVTATVGSVDAGNFALDIDGLGTQKIASVTGWYAYDTDSIFLPKNGGTYSITLGATQTDVTRIIELPMRAELISLDGNGRNLTFTVVGEGKVKVDLQNLGGQTPTVTGAAGYTLNGEILTIDIGANGSHTISITLPAPQNPPVITSNGGGATGAVAIAENLVAVTTVVSTDPNSATATRTYSISGGADAAKFGINPTTGALVFLAAPDRETPTDVGLNNVYDVIVRVTNTLGLYDEQALAVTVNNVAGPNQTGTSAANTMTGTNEEETINGAGGNDTISGLGGNDNLQGGAGNDFIYGGDGNDTITGGDGNDTINGDAGNDTINGNAGTDTIDGGEGNDTINGDAGIDTLRGNNGDDIINGGADNDFIYGGANNDTLRGDAGNDTINGESGNDTITGGAGNDTMTGGADADMFLFNAAISEIGNSATRGSRDSITDFQVGVDKIDFNLIDANTGVGGNQAFTLLATQGAAFTAAGQLRFVHSTVNGVAITTIEGNVNSNLAADFRLELVGTHTLTSSDFIL